MTETSACRFLQLPNEILLCLFDCLTVPDIQAFRQCCRQMWDLSRLSSVWFNAYRTYILKSNVMTPRDYDRLSSLSPEELARWTILAYRHNPTLNMMTSSDLQIRHFGDIQQSNLEHAKLFERGGELWLVTYDKNRDIFVWDCATLKMVDHCSPSKDGPENWCMDRITITFHTHEGSDPVIAVHFESLVQKFIYLMTLAPSGCLKRLTDSESADRLLVRSGDVLIAVYGDNLVLRPEYSIRSVIIRNWKTQEQCELGCPNEDQSWNLVHEVFFLPQIIIVIRGYSASVYVSPALKPLQDKMLVHMPCSTLKIPGVSAASLSWHHGGVLPTVLVHAHGVLMELSIINEPSNSHGIITTEQYNFVPALTMSPCIRISYGGENRVTLSHNGIFIKDTILYMPAAYRQLSEEYNLCVSSLPKDFHANHQHNIKTWYQFDKPYSETHYNGHFGIIALTSWHGVQLFKLGMKAQE